MAAFAPIESPLHGETESPLHALETSQEIDDMPLDQAIYIPETDRHQKMIVAVGRGYVYQFNSSSGASLKFARFCAPAWGDSALCYDDVHDKIIACVWNEQRANDGFGVETQNQKRLFRIDPASLKVEFSAADPSSDALFSDSGEIGPRRLLFTGGQLFCMRPGLMELDPSDFSLIQESNSGFPNLGANNGVGWCDFVEEPGGPLWVTDNCNQFIGNFDRADLNTSTSFNCQGGYTFPAVDIDYGLVTFPTGNFDPTTLTNGLQWSTTPSDSNFPSWPTPYPPGQYVVSYEGGAAVTAVGVNTDYHLWIFFRGVFQRGFFCPQFPVGGDVIYNPDGPAWTNVETTDGIYPSAADVTAGESGAPGASQSGFNYAGYSEMGVKLAGYDGLDGIVSAMSFRLKRVVDFVFSGPQAFNPYGIAVDTASKKVFTMANRSGVLGVFDNDPSSPTYQQFHTTALDAPNAVPYRVRLSPNDGKLYIPTYAGNSVLKVNPTTEAIEQTYSGFDSPFDVVFTPDKAFAVQHGRKPLRKIPLPT